MNEAEKTKHADVEPGAQAPGMQHEADIGSGEKTPGEIETDEIVKSVPPLPKDGAAQQA